MVSNKLSNKEMHEVELWTSISDTITILYDELIDAEIEYGVFSKEYNAVMNKIKLSLEVESEIENNFFENPDLLTKICHYPAFVANGRLQERLENDYRAILNNKDSKINQRMNTSLEKIVSLLNDDDKKTFLCNITKQSNKLILCNYSFLLTENKSFLSLIEKELGNNPDEERRKELISLKNMVISSMGALEKMYFSICDFDSLLSFEGMFSEYADISMEEYRNLKNIYFKEKCFKYIESLNSAKKDGESEQDWLYELHLTNALNNMNDYSQVYDFVSKHFEDFDKSGSLYIISEAIENAEIDKKEGYIKKLNFK